jgi:predicted lipid-binding transport protein (Tim44 family)
MNTTKLIAAVIVIALIGLPSLSFARARGGGYGGGYSSGSRGGSPPGSIGSRGSRTYEQNGAKPIEQSTTTKPSTAAPPSTSNGPTQTAQQAPARQPSFMQRNPLLAGLAAGIAGSYIGHLLFGATDSSASTNTAGEQVGETSTAAGSSSSAGILLFLILLGAGAFFYFLKVRRPVPDFSGISRSSATSGNLLRESSATTHQTTAVVGEVTSADKAAFQQLLTDIQTAWSSQDLAGLRRFVTPEMLSYFGTALAEQASLELANHVEDLVLVEADVRETWIEDTTQYATIGLRWSARDYTVSLTKQRGEPGHLVEGSEETATESSEVWTFMRHQNGKWLLSAIQQ